MLKRIKVVKLGVLYLLYDHKHYLVVLWYDHHCCHLSVKHNGFCAIPLVLVDQSFSIFLKQNPLVSKIKGG